MSKAQMMAAKYKPRKISIIFNKELRNLLRSFWEADLWDPFWK